MTEERPSASSDAPAPGPLLVLGAWVFVAGLALGMFQPMFVADIGATLVAGPTYVGLIFLLCLAFAIVMGALAFFGARWFTVPAFIACGSLALGILAGFWVAAALGIGFAANRPAATTPIFAPSSPVRPSVIREAPATVVLRLDGAPGFTANPGDQRYTAVDEAGNVVADGVFGQWCYSGPDTEELASVETIDVGTLGEATVWAELRLMPFGGVVPMSIPLPRVQVRLVQPDGSVSSMWTGQGQVEARDGLAGRVVFTDLAPDGSNSSPATLTGELSWTCSQWLAGDP